MSAHGSFMQIRLSVKINFPRISEDYQERAYGLIAYENKIKQ